MLGVSFPRILVYLSGDVHPDMESKEKQYEPRPVQPVCRIRDGKTLNALFTLQLLSWKAAGRWA
jgi:hypothetical protein